jgi:hypothetical protein
MRTMQKITRKMCVSPYDCVFNFAAVWRDEFFVHFLKSEFPDAVPTLVLLQQ